MSDPEDPILQLLQMGRHQMPGVWRYLLPEELHWLKAPNERHATCDDCFKVKLGECRDDCRCCTYFPELGNFQLGLSLLSGGGDVVSPLVKSRDLLPIGLSPTPLRYQRAVVTYSRDRFGEEVWMRCPFVEPDTFHCRIYPFRNSVCSTFFCTNDHGEVGHDFWGKVQDLVGQIEIAIAQWCMDEIGFPHEQFTEQLDLLSEDIDGMSNPETLAWSEESYRALWGDWCGRELEFFTSCGELVMERRNELFDIARSQPGRHALLYEQRTRDAIDAAHRHHASQVPSHNTEHRPIDSNLYKLQLAERQVWELPFQQGAYALAETVEIVDNPRDDAWSKSCPEPLSVRGGGGEKPVREFIGDDEAELLRIFAKPRRFDERLFERPEVTRLTNARELLARWLRLEILVPVEP